MKGSDSVCFTVVPKTYLDRDGVTWSVVGIQEREHNFVVEWFKADESPAKRARDNDVQTITGSDYQERDADSAASADDIGGTPDSGTAAFRAASVGSASGGIVLGQAGGGGIVLGKAGAVPNMIPGYDMVSRGRLIPSYAQQDPYLEDVVRHQTTVIGKRRLGTQQFAPEQ